jgi:ABC-type antimicrobial peptide transport system permease subunit
MSLKERRMPAAFYPRSQHGMFLYNFLARYTGDTTSLVPKIRRAVRAVDPNLPVDDVTKLVHLVDGSVLNQRLVAQLCTFFGILAAFLACIGIYGVVSYGIARRTSELGIRMALGAERRDVLWMVLWETLRLILIGVALGLAVALAASRMVESELFGLKSYDPLAIALAVTAMVGAASFAGYLPARRATGIDPMMALRYE